MVLKDRNYTTNIHYPEPRQPPPAPPSYCLLAPLKVHLIELTLHADVRKHLLHFTINAITHVYHEITCFKGQAGCTVYVVNFSRTLILPSNCVCHVLVLVQS